MTILIYMPLLAGNIDFYMHLHPYNLHLIIGPDHFFQFVRHPSLPLVLEVSASFWFEKIDTERSRVVTAQCWVHCKGFWRKSMPLSKLTTRDLLIVASVLLPNTDKLQAASSVNFPNWSSILLMGSLSNFFLSRLYKTMYSKVGKY